MVTLWLTTCQAETATCSSCRRCRTVSLSADGVGCPDPRGRPGRTTWCRRARRRRVPPRPPPRRLRRRRPVLRAVRLPDHHTAAGAPSRGQLRHAPLVEPPLHTPHSRRRRGRDRGARHLLDHRRADLGRDRHVDLVAELAPDRRGHVVLGRRPLAAAPRLVVVDRGAVLPGVAARPAQPGRAREASGSAPRADRRGGRGHHGRRVVPLGRPAVAGHRGPVTHLLRDRHPSRRAAARLRRGRGRVDGPLRRPGTTGAALAERLGGVRRGRGRRARAAPLGRHGDRLPRRARHSPRWRRWCW